ncbi:CHRD domain-containing protein [Dokdonia sinensis]|nr:CHRD domain-containing protein [Dokdonia sinensis]
MKSKVLNFGLLLCLLLCSLAVDAQVVINEVLPGGTVELKNNGTNSVDLTNYWLCERPIYNRVGDLNIASGNVANLQPGEILVIDNFNIIDGVADEVALYSSASFSSTNAIVDFVQWGAPSSTTRAGVAVSAGLWNDAALVAPAITAGNSLAFNGSTNALSTPDDFSVGTPTIGAENQAVAEDVIFTAQLSGIQENPAALTNASGSITATLSGNELVITGSFQNLSGDFDANIAGGAHVHRAIAGRNGGIEFLLNTTVSPDLRSGTYEAANNTFTLTDDQVAAINARELYVNIHTTAFPGGELRGQLLIDADTVYQTTLLGSNEFPAVNTIAEGNMLFELEGDQLTVSGSFDGLSSEIRVDLANGAHIHDNFAGRNGPVIFPLNPTYDDDNQGAVFEAANNVFTLSADQLTKIADQGLYINIHSVNNPGGELRGQIVPLSSSVFGARLTGAQEVIVTDTAANGRIFLSNDGQGNISVSGSFNDLSADLNTALAGGIHVHLAAAGRNGGIEFIITPDVATDNRNAVIRASENTFTLTNAQVDALFDRNLYVNVHSLDFAPGEIRGQLQPLVQTYLGTALSGQNEVQPIITTGNGNVQLELSGLNLVVTGAFNNLIGDFDANIAGGSHLHLSDATGNGGIQILINATTDADLKGGVYTANTNAFEITQAQRDFLLNDEIYLNIHSTQFASGELRGQILNSENNFPVSGFAITSPADNADISIGTDDENPYTVTYDATTDPNGNLVVYSYQLAVDSAFENIVVNQKVGTALQFDNNNAVRDALIAEGVAMDDTVTYYQRVLASDGSVSASSVVQTVNLTLECAALSSEIVFSTDNLNNTTTVSEDGLSAVICVDTVADPIGVTMVNPEDSIGANAGWIITDLATNEILALPAAGPFDLNGAGTGTCQIWYIRYEDGLLGKEVGGNLSDLEGCFDLSNPLDVIREEADGGTVALDVAASSTGTTTVSADGLEAVICVDGNADPLVVTHENPSAENLSYRYVITDAATGLILNVVASDTISLDGAGAGTCEIWGWSYRGVPNNGLDQIGQPLSSLDDLDCSDISDNAITVIREVADGGTVALDVAASSTGTTTVSADGLEAVICVDGNADPLVVTHENPGAENLSYRYVITDAATGLILNVVASDTISLDGAGAGTCEIWGWSYRGVPNNGLDQIGEPLSSLDDLDCSDISDNAITVIREVADGGTVALDVAASSTGTTTVSADGLEAVICVDGNADPLVVTHENPGAENLSYRYVITDAATGLILNVVASDTISLDGAGAGTCEIWGWSYRGVPNNGLDQIGEPLSSLDDLDCSDISDNAITVIREVADGGTVALDVAATDAQGEPTTVVNDDVTVTIQVGDGIPNPIVVSHENPGAENLSYRYVITDAATGLILNVVNSTVIDLDGAGVGVCEIWGWSYRGVPNNGLDQIGEPLSSLDDLDCSDISDNAVTVNRIVDGEPPVVDNPPVDIFVGTGSNADECGANVVYDDITGTDNSGQPVTVTLIEGLPSGSLFPVGATEVVYELADVNGNSITVSFTVTVTDTTFPTIECIDDQIEGGDDNGEFIVPDYSTIIDFNDNCSDELGITFTQNIEAGTVLTQGSETEVVITVTDAAGNATDCSFNLIVDENLSVGEETLDNSITMYPNPATNFFAIDFAGSTTQVDVTMYDILGKQVLVIKQVTNAQSIDISTLTTGVYMVEITDNNNNSRIVRRLIKR